MTRMLFREDAYLAQSDATVTAHTPEGGIVLDRTVFYPSGGGQPGDSGQIEWDSRTLEIATTVKAGEGDIALVPSEPQGLPPVGARLSQKIDWERRHRHMRVHTALHLLSVIIPLPVTGGAVGSEKGRLDFDMPESPEDKTALDDRLIRIGSGQDQVDLQPCGGTHVARTGEIGGVRLGRIEKKGRRNRRVYLHLE